MILPEAKTSKSPLFVNSSGKKEGAPKSFTFVDLGPELAFVWYFIPEKILPLKLWFVSLLSISSIKGAAFSTSTLGVFLSSSSSSK